MTHANRRSATVRRGFTLVEILVVLAIIAVLIGLGAAAIMKTRVVQETRNTSTLITKVDQALQKQYRITVETARNEPPCALAVAMSGNPPDLDRAKVIHVKLRLIQDFPTSFNEIKNPPGLLPNPTYLRGIQSASVARTWQDESAACLYLALKRQSRGGEFDPDTSLSSQELIDPGDGVKEIVDAWKHPLVFTRFPGFGNSAPLLVNFPQFHGGAQPFQLPSLPSNDPVDADGKLTDPNWVTNFSAAFQKNVHPVVAGKTFTLFPVISSSGVDGTTFTIDDIYNFQLSTK
jgi:prepilin-type N-terminal cleavage/methylation domain-containing protein